MLNLITVVVQNSNHTMIVWIHVKYYARFCRGYYFGFKRFFFMKYTMRFGFWHPTVIAPVCPCIPVGTAMHIRLYLYIYICSCRFIAFDHQIKRSFLFCIYTAGLFLPLNDFNFFFACWNLNITYSLKTKSFFIAISNDSTYTKTSRKRVILLRVY